MSAGAPGPTVSVVVPTRDRAAYLGDCLQALSVQECHADLEFVIVDNASADATADVIEAWARRDPRFRPHHETRLGRSAAINSGAAISRGDVLLFTDDDVIPDRGWAEALRSRLSGLTGVVIAGGPIMPVPVDLSAWPPWVPDDSATDLGGLDHGSDARPLGAFEFLWGGNMAVPRTVFEALGPFDETIGRRGDHRGTYEDIEYQRRVWSAGGHVWYEPHARIRHRVERRQASPRNIVAIAFARGRNAETVGTGATRPVDARRADVIRSFSVWAARSLALRLDLSRRSVEAARACASRAGAAMERATARRSSFTRSALERALWYASRAVVRATPGRVR